MNPLNEAYGKNEPTILDFLKENGLWAQLPLALFFAGILLALLIQIKQLGFRFRLAFLPFSFLPFLVGVTGFFAQTADFLQCLNQGASRQSDPNGAFLELGRIFSLTAITSCSSIVMLLLSSALLLSKRTDDRK